MKGTLFLFPKLLTLFVLGFLFIFYSSSTLSQTPLPYQSKSSNISIVKSYFPAEAKVKILNSPARTGNIIELNSQRVILQNYDRPIYTDDIKEITFLKNAMVRVPLGSRLFSGNEIIHSFTWRISINRLKLAIPKYGQATINLKGVMISEQDKNYIDMLSESKGNIIVCRINNLKYFQDNDLVIEGVIMKLKN
jgi:hypothetical protein